MSRDWPIVQRQISDAGPASHGVEIRCGICGKAEFAAAGNRPGGAAEIWAASRFASRNWKVGQKPDLDRCPECAARERAEWRARKAKARQKERQMQQTLPSGAEAPRTMDFDDRRIINRKLEEVYLDATSGYGDGWSDKRVAEDLGVPRAWVKELREQNFGPARDNEEIRAFLKDFDAAAAKVADIDKRARSAAADATLAMDEFRALAKTAAEIRKSVA